MSSPRDVEAALGKVVATLPGGGEVRAGQLAMAEAVARVLSGRRHLVVRAGTGTGKSLGYVVPAVLSGKRVLVATATKALQDQLARKDLPQVAAALDHRFSFAVLKGRSNYLCMQRVREAQAQTDQGRLGEDTAPGELGQQASAILDWAASTVSGDRAELAIEPDPRVWASFSVTSDECPGAFRCPAGGECFAEAARSRAASADIVVVNLHLLGADLASGGTVLPEHDALVVDEAHELEDVLTASLGIRVTSGRLRGAAVAARSALGATTGAHPTGQARGAPTGSVEAIFESAEQLDRILAERAGERLLPGFGGELAAALELLASRLERVEGELQMGASTRRSAEASEGGDEAVQRLMRAALVVGHLREDLARLVALDDDQVAWVGSTPRPSLELAPVDVAPILVDQVFSKLPVVLTSATVPAGLASRLGADAGETDVIDVGSPFAYERNALLYCAAHLPDRRRPEAEGAIADELAALIDAAGGRTLALFTSRGAMERAAGSLRSRVAHPILVQGEGSKGALVEAFTAEAEACLFATMGFWQGVDVPGASLALVVIDRIPFARPDDPLAAARRDRAGSAAFRTVDLPRAASLLAQGAGRLIRTSEDRGVVAVLDSRLATASYRWDLVRALPPMRRTKQRAEAESFLRAIHEEASVAEPDAAPPRPRASRRSRLVASAVAPAPAPAPASQRSSARREPRQKGS